MTLPGPYDDIRLTSGDIELIRGVLVICSQLLHWAERWAARSSALSCTTLPSGPRRPRPGPAPV